MLWAVLSCISFSAFCLWLSFLLCGNGAVLPLHLAILKRWLNKIEERTRNTRKTFTAFLLVIIPMILILCLTSCTSTQAQVAKIPVPEPYRTDGTSRIIYNAESDTVIMDYDYFKSLWVYIDYYATHTN